MRGQVPQNVVHPEHAVGALTAKQWMRSRAYALDDPDEHGLPTSAVTIAD